MKWDTKLEDVSAQTKYPIGDGDHGAIKPEMYQNHGVPYIRVGDIKWDGRIDRSKMVYISEEVNKLNPKSFLYPGDIIISKTGATIGKVAIIPNDFTISNTTASIGKVSLDFTKANSRFVFWCMKSQNFQEQMWKVSHKSAQPGFNVKDLKIFKIPLPPLPTQQKIASILDAADTLRQKDKALLAKYDELTQSLFLDMFGDIINNQKKWQYINFGTIFKSIRYGASTPPVYINEGIPFIRATNVKNGTVVKKGMVFISIEEASKIEKCKLKEGDLIVVRSGANTGDCCRIPSNYKDGYGGFDLIIEIEEPYSTFYNFLLNTKAGKKTLEPLTRRAGQPHLNSKQLTELQVFKTPLNLQTQFAECVAIIEQQKAIAQASLEKSEELFNSLLQKAFKGELA